MSFPSSHSICHLFPPIIHSGIFSSPMLFFFISLNLCLCLNLHLLCLCYFNREDAILESLWIYMVLVFKQMKHNSDRKEFLFCFFRNSTRVTQTCGEMMPLPHCLLKLSCHVSVYAATCYTALVARVSLSLHSYRFTENRQSYF